MAVSFQTLRDFMDQAMEKMPVSGIDCIIYQNHEQIFRHTAGYSEIETKTPMKADALYNIYSAGKVITCVAALQLVEQGRLLLLDPVSKYLPAYANMQVKHGTFVILPARKTMRILDLFLMTSGLSYELDTPHMRKLMADTGKDFDTMEFVNTLAKEPLLFEPGEGWNYGYSHDVLGAVIEAITGMPFGDYLQQAIFDPLGMKDTGFELRPDNEHRIAPQYSFSYETGTSTRISSQCMGKAGSRHQSGGGGLISSSEDYILFADALACGGLGHNGARILSRNSLDLLRKNHLHGLAMADYRKMVPSTGSGYGLGVAVTSDPVASCTLAARDSFAWGGIGGVQNYFDPDHRLSYFVAQHTMLAPKEPLEPFMRNIVYTLVSNRDESPLGGE